MKNGNDRGRALSASEREFLDNLLRKTQPTLIRILKYKLGDMYDDLKDECLSEVYMTAVCNANKLMASEEPEKWLFACTKIIALNRMSSRLKYLSRVTDTDMPNISTGDDVFELALYNIWLEQDVYRRLKEELTPREREVFTLMFEEKLSCKEISQRLSVSESTLWNIRKSIKDKYRYAIKNKLF